MINAQELRLGNLIKKSSTGQIYKVSAGMIVGIEVENESPQFEPLYEPIPLNEELLEKIGFVKSVIDRYKSWQLQVNERVKFLYCDNKLDFGILSVAQYEWLNIAEIKYIHQLQNFYYSITGKELVINA
jgi:hypothetical protein